MRAFFCFAILFFLFGGVFARDFVLVTTEENPSKEVAKMQPLADFLAPRLRSYGITGVRVVVMEDIPAVVRSIRSGMADMYYDSPYPILSVDLQVGLDIRLRRWKKGKSEYGSIILALKESEIGSLADLSGKLLGFETSSSTSGFFLPLSDIEQAGIESIEYPLRMRSARMSVPLGRIGYFFSGDEENSMSLLLRKQVQAIAIGEHDYENLKLMERERVKVLHHTRRIPRQLVAFRKGLDKELVNGVIRTLKGLGDDVRGREVLRSIENTTCFDDIPADNRSALVGLRASIQKRQP